MRRDPSTSPGVRLMNLRIIWGALLMGQLTFLAVIVLVVWNRQSPAAAPDPRVLDLLFYVSVGMLLTMVTTGFLIRSFVYRKGRAFTGTDAVSGGAYASGNIVLWALCEGASFFGLVGAMLNCRPWPHLAVPIVAMAVQALTFPTGGPMRNESV